MSGTQVISRKVSADAPRAACKRVVVAAPKGGVGKTTLVMALLVCARIDGHRAIGINMDEQESLSKWSGYREQQRANPDAPAFVEVPVFTRRIDDFRQVASETGAAYEIAFYDTPPGHGHNRQAVKRLCEQADLILIPTGASDVDLDEVIPFGLSVAGAKAVFVLNKVNRRAASYQRARKRLVKAGRLCPVDVPLLEIIHNQFKLGLAAPDTDAKGADDFRAVWDFISHEVSLA